MPGWRDEADAEDIDAFAEHTVNNDGRREYEDAYASANKMKTNGITPEEIRKAIIREPDQPKPNQQGQVGMNSRKSYAAARSLANIRRRAVEDSLAGKPPSYKD